MLEGLNRIVWSSLNHAYGPATDVPAQIRALASRSETERKKALTSLYSNIFHQGTRWQATAHAVPFLIELLNSPSVAGKDKIVMLLVHCATGYAEEHLPAGLDTGAWRSELARHSSEDSEDGEYLHWFIDAYEAVRSGVPTFARLAEDGDKATRMAATYALAWFREDATSSVEVVRRRMGAEQSPHLVANSVLALGLLARYLGKDESARLRPFLSASDPLVQQAAAIALVTSLGVHAPLEAIHFLGGALVVAEDSVELPWNDGDMLGYISKTIGSLGPQFLEEALAPMFDALRRSSGTTALEIAGVLIQLLFPNGAERLSVAELTREQRAFLTALEQSPTAWQYGGLPFGNFSLMMSNWGLPSSIEKMRAFLGK